MRNVCRPDIWLVETLWLDFHTTKNGKWLHYKNWNSFHRRRNISRPTWLDGDSLHPSSLSPSPTRRERRVIRGNLWDRCTKKLPIQSTLMNQSQKWFLIRSQPMKSIVTHFSYWPTDKPALIFRSVQSCTPYSCRSTTAHSAGYRSLTPGPSSSAVENVGVGFKTEGEFNLQLTPLVNARF